MSSYSASSAARPGEVAGTLRLLGLLLLAVVLMVLDHRGGWLVQVRQHGETMMQPLWWLAAMPGRMGESIRQGAVSREQLIEDNRNLRNALLLSGARVARLQATVAENTRMRALLDAAQAVGEDVQLVPILDVDMDPTRQRLLLAAGSSHGIESGQPVIDAGGLLGQVISLTPTTATVLLLTDPDHAVPVTVARTGARLIAQGSGRVDQLEVPNVPFSADLEVGDEIVSSGLGGRFPPGFSVGRVIELRSDEGRAFLVAVLAPAAHLDRGREVLLLRNVARGGVLPIPVSPVVPLADPAQAAPAAPAADGEGDGRTTLPITPEQSPVDSREHRQPSEPSP
ncbi:MAG: rod shape-determining protein MreC [Pseudoxanthomonas suwonensis]|nr:rod shape-determining protein MreC [Pseudoxanthomonas suwonensis]